MTLRANWLESVWREIAVVLFVRSCLKSCANAMLESSKLQKMPSFAAHQEFAAMEPAKSVRVQSTVHPTVWRTNAVRGRAAMIEAGSCLRQPCAGAINKSVTFAHGVKLVGAQLAYNRLIAFVQERVRCVTVNLATGSHM